MFVVDHGPVVQGSVMFVVDHGPVVQDSVDVCS